MNVRMDASRVMRSYSSAFQRFQRLEGFSQAQLLTAEAGVILKQWAGWTKVGDPVVASLRARYRAEKRAFGATNIDKNAFGISVATGRGGGYPGEVWFRHPKSKSNRSRFQVAGLISDSGSFTPSFIHWKDPDWANITAGAERYGEELKKLLPFAPKSVGLARQSIIQIADALSIDLTAVKGGGTLSSAGIAKARAAIASSGRSYQNGVGHRGGDGTKDYVDLLCRLPYAGKIGMDATLLRVIAGRAKYIETSYQKGAFDSLSTAARAFPNLFRVVAGL